MIIANVNCTPQVAVEPKRGGSPINNSYGGKSEAFEGALRTYTRITSLPALRLRQLLEVFVSPLFSLSGSTLAVKLRRETRST